MKKRLIIQASSSETMEGCFAEITINDSIVDRISKFVSYTKTIEDELHIRTIFKFSELSFYSFFINEEILNEVSSKTFVDGVKEPLIIDTDVEFEKTYSYLVSPTINVLSNGNFYFSAFSRYDNENLQSDGINLQTIKDLLGNDKE